MKLHRLSLLCFSLLSAAALRADCSKSVSGNVTLIRCLSNDADAAGGAQWHFFVSSSDPATRAFRMTIKVSDQGYTTAAYGVPKPNATVHIVGSVLMIDDGSAPYPTPAPLVSVTVDELQAVSSTTLRAADGSLQP